jgi:hypothetical protein
MFRSCLEMFEVLFGFLPPKSANFDDGHLENRVPSGCISGREFSRFSL